MYIRNLGHSLQVFRVSKKLTQDELARKLSILLNKTVDANYVDQIESQGMISSELLGVFSQALEASPQKILKSAQLRTEGEMTMTDQEILEDVRKEIDYQKWKSGLS